LAIALAKANVSPARWEAFEILRKVEAGAFSSILLAEQKSHLKDSDRALCHELVLGVLRWQLTLDSLITHFSNRKIESLDRSVVTALRLGLYQLRFLTRIPASAAVNESVKLVQAARLSSARTFVNAVLRRATREPEFDPASNVSPPIQRLSIETSHPIDLLERWVEAFGLEEAAAFARANNETPQVSFRIVRRVAREEDVLARLQIAGVQYEASPIVAGGYRTPKGANILRELAANGEIYFQDEASQLVAKVVEPRAGDAVLDLCAAPGGKTALIADQSESVRIVASDFVAKRLATVETTLAAQKVKNVALVLLDAGHQLPFAPGTFDRVLVDAPCSGTGTLRHNPEIRWRITNDDIERLAEQQLRFLLNAATALKSGGKLFYSTCSVEIEENEAVVAKFLEASPNFQQNVISDERLQPTSTGALRTWPHRDRTDGFFIAAFEKKE
jgi:16S rRNA (cytosine967-C5)-methyltransferase